MTEQEKRIEFLTVTQFEPLVKIDIRELAVTIHCAAKIKAECDTIATADFRKVIDALKTGNFQLTGVKCIITQAECILNVADNKFEEA